MAPGMLPLVGAGPGEEGAESATGARRRVLLICPPFQHAELSPLSLPQLATLLRQDGTPCFEAYFHLDLLRLIGLDKYRSAAGVAGLERELLFAEGLHGEPQDAAARAQLERLFGVRAQRDEIRCELEACCLARIEQNRPDLVGLTTSFNQLLPALWLARVIKRQAPRITIVLGGAACAQPMADRIVDAYPQIDRVVSGPGERPLLALGRGADPPEKLLANREPFELDVLPMPDYRAFLEAAEATGCVKALTFESSRGCWWGQRVHCAFCGLNGADLEYREKSTARVLDELLTLWRQHRKNLYAVDAILSRGHLRGVMPELAALKTGPMLMYEVKANLDQADVALLRRARVRSVQVGLESLSTPLLKLLRKGTDTIRNLAVLKWCRERGIVVWWNQLFGIPGEELQHYQAQISLMQHIPQLPPPELTNRIRIDRYSPYFANFREHGWTELRPLAAYRSLHPQLADDALFDIAYHFEGTGGVSTDAYAAGFVDAVQQWRDRHAQGDGLFLDPDQGLVRNGAGRGTRLSAGAVLDRVLECTHDVAPIERVLQQAGCRRADLDELARHGIVYIEGGRVLNLAVRTRVPEDG